MPMPSTELPQCIPTPRSIQWTSVLGPTGDAPVTGKAVGIAWR